MKTLTTMSVFGLFAIMCVGLTGATVTAITPQEQHCAMLSCSAIATGHGPASIIVGMFALAGLLSFCGLGQKQSTPMRRRTCGSHGHE